MVVWEGEAQKGGFGGGTLAPAPPSMAPPPLATVSPPLLAGLPQAAAGGVGGHCPVPCRYPEDCAAGAARGDSLDPPLHREEFSDEARTLHHTLGVLPVSFAVFSSRAYLVVHQVPCTAKRV